jgi:hypothetical protein
MQCHYNLFIQDTIQNTYVLLIISNIKKYDNFQQGQTAKKSKTTISF